MSRARSSRRRRNDEPKVSPSSSSGLAGRGRLGAVAGGLGLGVEEVAGAVEPRLVGQAVGAELLGLTLFFVVVGVPGSRRSRPAAGESIMALESLMLIWKRIAEFEFPGGRPFEGPVQVAHGVAPGDDVDAEVGPFAEEVDQDALRAWASRRRTDRGGEPEIVVGLPEVAEPAEIEDGEIDRRELAVLVGLAGGPIRRTDLGSIRGAKSRIARRS